MYHTLLLCIILKDQLHCFSIKLSNSTDQKAVIDFLWRIFQWFKKKKRKTYIDLVKQVCPHLNNTWLKCRMQYNAQCLGLLDLAPSFSFFWKKSNSPDLSNCKAVSCAQSPSSHLSMVFSLDLCFGSLSNWVVKFLFFFRCLTCLRDGLIRP